MNEQCYLVGWYAKPGPFPKDCIAWFVKATGEAFMQEFKMTQSEAEMYCDIMDRWFGDEEK